MDVLVAGQQNVPRPELVRAPLNGIGHIAGEEKENLVKCMVVKFNFRRDAVQIVVAFKQVVLHGLAERKCFSRQTHQNDPPHFYFLLVYSNFYLFSSRIPQVKWAIF